MNKAPSKLVAFVAIVIGVFALIMLTKLSAPVTTPKTDAELEKEQQEQMQKAQAEAQKKAAQAAPAVKPPAVSSGLVRLGHDGYVGPQVPGNAPEITVQWSWTPEVEADPMKVYATIVNIAKQIQHVRVHAVNTDEVTGIPNGVFVGGTEVTAAGPDGSIKFDQHAIEDALGHLQNPQ